MNNRGRWRIGALASAIALLGSLASLEAHALALGRITVQSALGEPLRAEIDIADIKPEEASSLKAGVAPPDTFKAAGLEYGSVVAGVEVSLQRRADGRAYLRLSSNKPVTEPFVDLILEANWANGRITRDYTMLFDPPALRSSAAGSAAAPTAPILSRPLPPVAPPAKGIASIPYSPSTAARPAPVAKAPAASLEKVPAGGDKQVTVKAGDTAGKIAAQNKPASVSLDQMLVALLRSNPDAFIGGNVNRVKSGAVLDIPSAETASAISSSEASQTIVAQSKDFNNFRRKLAESVPATQTAGADRQAGGKVQAKVEDRAPASATPDKLTLSKGAVQGKAASATEDKIAKERQAKEASARVAELSKNINDLNKLGGAPSAAAPAPAATAAKTPGVAVPAPASVAATPAAAAAPAAAAPATPVTPAVPVAVPAPAPAAVASAAAAAPAVQAASSAAAPAAAPQPAAVASEAAPAPVAAAPAAPAAPKKPAVTPPPPEPSLVDELLENPLLLPIAGGILLLLAGFGFYRYRQRGSSAQVDSSFLESRLQPDSFFGASGGQRIDTNESNVTGSSLVYSPSQLDAAGDVDPVAEADVYLAYGRDLQAEEILKEAMRTSPMRVAIHAKLMEIYAKRRDSKAFETVAVEAFNLTHGNGPEWAYITEMGRELDPANPMYQPGGQPAGATFNPGGTLAMNTQPAPIAPTPAAPSVDVDLDLDFSLGDEPDTSAAAISAPPPAPAPAPRPPEPTVAMKPQPAAPVMEMDFGSATVALPPTAAPAAKPAEAPEPDVAFEGLNFTPEPFTPPPKPVAAAKAAPAPAPAADSGLLEFDLGSLSLDLNGPTTESPALAVEASPSADGPLETKFLLAEEFRSLGDTDGARSLAEEVLAEASGPLKVKAQAFLNALS
ncbi:pilus assembly protein FimV [Polaromonas sp. YR568]|uniref:FimV/HubP family polar landmark protein n=1 Tax=Polaromonas sp. YR568 TaxID=1855301 RepID=UPI0008F21987|nr:FimV/HubP family polar landmark protein [Polaromonas sp. YR568]SFU95286.1 pilus assembly protein FimV [Polaromonas sp. YR568]